MKDFRYEKGGTEIEAFQMTPANRYAQKEWPAWMDSRWLMTIDGEEWLERGGEEQAIPPLGWICNNPDGTITIRGAMEMEEWAKVVPVEVKEVTPAADGMPDESHLAKAFPQHMAQGKTVEDYTHKPGEAAAPIPVATPENVLGDTNELRNEMMSAIKMLHEAHELSETGLPPKGEEALDYLKKALAKRTKWCNCIPGDCYDENDHGCRQSSPLL